MFLPEDTDTFKSVYFAHETWDILNTDDPVSIEGHFEGESSFNEREAFAGVRMQA